VPTLVRARNLLLLPLLTLAVLAAVTALSPVADASAVTRSQKSSQRVTVKINRAASIALHQIGDPYRYGSAGPNSFDCSGLMQFSFRRAGISIPRTAAAQAHRARHIPRNKMRRGDLMFFTGGGGIYHAAMFLKWSKGHVVMLHAPRTGQRVKIDRPWTNSWFAATMRR
jgi:cell wall-associated NlpC family hydrolase